MKCLVWYTLLLVTFCIVDAGRRKDRKEDKCRDVLDDLNVLAIKRPNPQYGVVVGAPQHIVAENLTSCERLKDYYGPLCMQEVGQRLCCRSCRATKDGCVDSMRVKFSYAGLPLTCKDFIGLDKCHCKNRYDVGRARKLVVATECCYSCNGVDLSDCDCEDRVSPEKPEKSPRSEDVFTSCGDLIAEYPELCRRFGQKKARCCKTCSDVDFSCLDTKISTWLVGGVRLSCPQLVSYDKCQCQWYHSDCCQSCQQYSAQDYAGCCADDPKFKTSVVIPAVGKGKDRIPRKKCSRCSCEELLAADHSGHLMRFVCDTNKNSARSRCCKTCGLVGYPPL